MKTISKWKSDDFELEMTTHWSFPKRGDWATHDAKWRGNWSPYIPRNIILRYSQEGDLVLDQFAGGGTTLVEAKLLNRNIIGVDCNDVALERCHEKTLKELIIKEQHNCKATGYWKTNSVKYNFLLIAHEYFFVFRK